MSRTELRWRLGSGPAIVPTGPQTYTGFGSGGPGAAYGADTTGYTLGTAFTVTSSGFQLTAVRIYLDSAGGSVLASSVASGGAPLLSNVYAGDPLNPGAVGPALSTDVTTTAVTMDAWNRLALAAPLALTSGQVYYACVAMPNGRYSVIASKFTSPLVAGPITFPQDGTVQGTSGTVKNGAFTTTSAGTSLFPPNSSASASWYGIDVEVSG